MPDGIRMIMATAAAEIGANIVEHAGAARPVPIRMAIETRSDQVTVLFSDRGAPAAVDLETVDVPDALAARGRGLALARALLQGLSYHHDKGGNHRALVSPRFG